MKILLVDDSKTIHAFVKGCFENVECELSQAFNGEEAVKMLDERPDYYNLVLLDWEMPVMKGPEVLKHLKETGNDTTVIMLTSRNETEDIVLMLEAGAAEYIMKPFTEELVFEKIESVLGVNISELSKKSA